MTNLTNPFGIPNPVIQQILQIFQTVPDLEWVKVYGSRAKGNFRANSDIDLAFKVRGPADPSARLLSTLDELPTPYRFDVTNIDCVQNQELHAHIMRVGKTLLNQSSP